MASTNREVSYERSSARGRCKERWRAPSVTVRPFRRVQYGAASEESPRREGTSRTRHLFTAWARIRRRIALAERIFLFSDFDGTLVPLQRRPSEVRIPPLLRHLLRRLAEGRVKIGIISGRALEDVQKKVGVEGIWYSGSHGYSIRDTKGQTLCLVAPETKLQMKAVWRSLNRRLRSAPGLKIEPKDGTIAVHYRLATRTERAWAYEALCNVLSSRKHLRLMQGKKVWEVLPEGTVDKWKAIQVILDREDFHPRKDLLIYMGDDVTDEAVFRKMRGLSVAAGNDRRTAAAFFLDSHLEVTEFLRRIGEIVEGRKEKCGGLLQGSTGTDLRGPLRLEGAPRFRKSQSWVRQSNS
jgi:trehalose 6-phosphate phosphatase